MSNKNVISFMNMKGGVGKTTLCVNIAHCLSKHPEFNKKILLIDLDPQFNSTQYLIQQEIYIKEIYENNKTIYNIFKERQVKPSLVTGEIETVVPQQDKLEYKLSENLYLVPGDLRMINVEKSVATGRDYKLTKFIKNNDLTRKYDFVLIDCPPTQSIYTLAAFYASNYYVMPVKPDFLSTLGINLFLNAIKEYNEELPHKIKCLGMVFVSAQDYTNHVSIKMQEIRQKYNFYIFNNYIKHSIKVPENAENSICLYDMDEFKQSIIGICEEFLVKYTT